MDPVKAEFWRLARDYLTRGTDTGLSEIVRFLKTTDKFRKIPDGALEAYIPAIYRKRIYGLDEE